MSPTPITLYACDICRREYGTHEGAAGCELRGIAPVGEARRGVLLGTPEVAGAFYENLTFAIAEDHGDLSDPHYSSVSLWAARNNGAGDSLGSEKCGSGGGAGLQGGRPSISREGLTHPTAVRLIAWLREEGIPPRVWNGSAIVSLEEYLASPSPENPDER